jgi:hypothetical protein
MSGLEKVRLLSCFCLILYSIFALTIDARAEIVKNGQASAGLARPLDFVRPSSDQIPNTLGVISYRGSGPVSHGGLIACHTLHTTIIYYGASWPSRIQEQQIIGRFLNSISNAPYLIS